MILDINNFLVFKIVSNLVNIVTNYFVPKFGCDFLIV